MFNFGGVSWEYTPNGVWVVLEHGFEVYLCEHYLPVSIIMPSLIRKHICEALTKRPQHPLTNQEE